MSELNIMLTFKAVDRIKAHLNRRFEKDASLYISKQETQKIKFLLINMNLKAINEIFISKLHSPEVLTKTIIRNSWLMHSIKQDTLNELFPIFDACKTDLFIDIMNDVIKNRIDVPFELKQLLDEVYYTKISVEKCEKKLEKEHKPLKILKICFKRVIQNRSSANDFCRKVNFYFSKYPSLKDDKNILSFNHLIYSEKIKLLRYIFSIKFLSSSASDEVWTRAVCKCGECALDEAIRVISSLDWDQKILIDFIANVIKRILIYEKQNYEILVEKIIDFYNNIFTHRPVRHHLVLNFTKDGNELIWFVVNDKSIEYLRGNISDKEKLDKIISLRDILFSEDELRYTLEKIYFSDEDINLCFNYITRLDIGKQIIREFDKKGIPTQTAQEAARKFLNWTSNDRIINSPEDIYKELIKSNGEKRWQYIISLSRNNLKYKAFFSKLLEYYGKEKKVQDFTIFLIKFFDIQENSHLIDTTIEYLNKNSNEDFKRKILQLIGDREYTTHLSKEFVLKRDFNLYKKLYGRI